MQLKNFDISPVYGSGRDQFSRRPFLGTIYVRSLHFARHLNSLHLRGLEFLVLSLRECRLLLF